MNELDTLRPYDAAPAELYDDVAATRARARFEQIVAFPPERVPETFDVPPRRPSRRTVMLRWAAIPAVAAVAFGVAVTLPDGVGTTPAFASWTARPTAVGAAPLADVEAACRFAVDRWVAPAQDPTTGFIMPEAEIAVVERRGDWSLALFRDADQGGSALCLTLDNAIGEVRGPVAMHVVVRDDADWDVTGYRGGSALPTLVRDSWGVAGARPLLHGDALAQDAVAYRLMVRAQFVDEGSFAMIDGVVGDEVAGVVIHAGDRDIQATVVDGTFVAWWPDVTNPFQDRMSMDPPFDKLPEAQLTLTVTLTDGTVHHDVRLANSDPFGFFGDPTG